VSEIAGTTVSGRFCGAPSPSRETISVRIGSLVVCAPIVDVRADEADGDDGGCAESQPAAPARLGSC
jgi:hypothetical protein